MAIKVVNMKTHKPTPNDIYIGRGSPLGNPFTHLPLNKTTAFIHVDTRNDAVEKYREYIVKEILNSCSIQKAVEEIKCKAREGDVNLVCWCMPKLCHGEILSRLITKGII